ncbi:citrate transporter [Azonexus sp.]|jgi:Na+/H+ antiporter NhaD/arsenite permease-like protein|uniref:citrate transporter n=1 Tax=Azonexus sp. TaxID=1872668 RepID=UPI002822076B|nr:citrate transporter [Azonexus sp.]MDR1996535.1 citrate transporter [Azonexus sp.]
MRRILALFCLLPVAACAASDLPSAAGIPIDFILFALTLLGVALLHHHTLTVALTGLVTISLYKILFTSFKSGPGVAGFIGHLGDEWVTIANLFCLLTGFALLARHFEKSHVPVILPKFLPADWKGGFVMLVMVFVISSFLDNIAAALIGGAMAHQLFRGKVHIGFLAAIVAASNAGGSGSVVGDTTTTMMWIAGISPGEVFHAYVAAGVALLIIAYFGAKQQHAYSPIIKHMHTHTRVDWGRIGIVATMLVFAVATNVAININFPELAEHFPFIGVAVWVAIILTIPVRRHDWEVLPDTVKGSIFLLSLVLCASMMPVEQLPKASWESALVLGFVSAVFDNIPLTALALRQGGYDWGFLAYAVGFGGSMLWFGSSAGVALSSMYPEAKSAVRWLRHGWHVALAYVVGFAVMLAVLGWHPHPGH